MWQRETGLPKLRCGDEVAGSSERFLKMSESEIASTVEPQLSGHNETGVWPVK